MNLKMIDKTIYRKRLNIVIGVVIASVLIISLGVSSLFISLIGDTDGSNFNLNLAGVVIAVVVVGFSLFCVRDKPYMDEVLYVWRLKQELNLIYRNTEKLKAAVDVNDHKALIIAYYNLKGSIQLYELDDNDLTLSKLKNDLQEFELNVHELGLTVDAHDYHRGLLEQIKSV